MILLNKKVKSINYYKPNLTQTNSKYNRAEQPAEQRDKKTLYQEFL